MPRLEGYGETSPVENGPALGGYGAVAMNTALITTMTKLPDQLRKTLTWDRGKELSAYAQFALETGTKVFFVDPHSPWQRPTNEDTYGLLRRTGRTIGWRRIPCRETSLVDQSARRPDVLRESS